MTSQNQPPQGGQNSHLTHFDPSGASKMVDVGDKPVSERRAKASGCVRMAPETLQRIRGILNRRKYISNLVRTIDQSTNGHLPN